MPSSGVHVEKTRDRFKLLGFTVIGVLECIASLFHKPYGCFCHSEAYGCHTAMVSCRDLQYSLCNMWKILLFQKKKKKSSIVEWGNKISLIPI